MSRLQVAAALAVFTILVCGASRARETVQARPDDLDLEVALNRSMKPGDLEDAVDAFLNVTVVNRGKIKVEGVLVIEFPQAKGGAPGRMPFTLDGPGKRSETFSVNLPSGKPLEMEIIFSLEIKGERLLTMSVFINKMGGFHVIGPFDGNTAEALERDFPPEDGVDLGALYEGKGGRFVRWQALDPTAVSAEGYHDLNRALGATENATAYAVLGVHAPKARKAVLSLGSDDGVKVWLNDRLIHTNAIHRGSAPGQDRVSITLDAGRNVFLLKICNDDGSWGFHFDLEDEKGEPLQNLQTEVGVARRFIRDTEFRVKDVTRTSALLTWKSDLPVRSTVTTVVADRGRTPVFGNTPKDEMIKPLPGAEPETLAESVAAMDHAVQLEGLEPGTRYLAWAEPALSGKPTPAIAFYTSPPEGLMQYLVLRLAVVVFTATTRPEDRDREGAEDPCPHIELERLKREMAQAVIFYWVTSGMRLFLNLEYFTTDTYYPGTHAGYGVGYGGRDEDVYEALLKEAGNRVEDYDGRLFISMEKHWDGRNNQWTYPASGGGTIGPESKPGYGKSAWKGGSNNAWLFCHEFQHQLDALYHHSHGPEHLFNHFQPWDDTAHRHGEHWDGNAWIFLEWAGYVTREHQGRPYLEPALGYRYFLNRFGRVVASADGDNDGIPDSDPIVPIDERRFGSDPAKKDTDGDGLEDMMEVMACHWLEYGHGEIWAGDPAAHHADPTRPDTDGDGLKDGEDPYPVHPIDPDIPKGNPDHPFAVLRDKAWEGKFTLGWDDAFLYLGVEAKETPANIKVLLDLDDDGWFVGADNFDIRVKDGVSFEPRFHNCGVEGKWPFYEAGRLEVGRDVFFESEFEKDLFRLRFRVARSPGLGLDLEAGERIGMLIAVGPKGGNGRPGQVGDLTLFEPHTFFRFTLKE